MKLTTFLLVIALVQTSAKGFSQVTLHENNAPLESVLKSIEKQSGYTFLVDVENVKSERISVDIKNASVAACLEACFKDQNITFRIVKNNVFITRSDPSFLEKLKDKAARLLTLPANFNGLVTDSLGQPLIGATVVLKDTKYRAVTDNSGKFVFADVPQGKYTVLVTYIGFLPSQRNIEIVGKDLDLRFTMFAASSALDQVQVIAYGTTTARYSVGSQAKVTSEEITSQPVMNPLSALEGRVPGLLVTANSGTPGSSVKITIRGQNTVGSTPNTKIIPDNPLFIIDGIPFAPQNAAVNKVQAVNDVNGVGQVGNGLSPFETIDPASIESIEVLKDADATSIYGARGANGVILITTKQGKAGKTKLTGNFYTGVSTMTHTMALLNTPQYLQMRTDAFHNDGIIPTTKAGSTYAPDLLSYDTNSNTNYLRQLFGKQSSTQNAGLALSGGDNRTTFYAGMNYGRQTYLFPGDFAENKLNGNMKIHHNSSDRKFNIDLSTGYNYDTNNVPGSPLILSAFNLPPDFPSLTNPDGSLKWDNNGVAYTSYISGFFNPLAYLKRADYTQQNSYLSSILISYELLPGLKLKTLAGYNNLTVVERSQFPLVAQNPASTSSKSVATKSVNNFYTWDVEPQISYDKQFGKHKIGLLVGGTLQKQDNNYQSITGTGFTNDLLLSNVSLASTITSSDGDVPYKYNAGFGRINYLYDNKYILDLTGRFDGSSRFAPGKQWGKFGSAAAGWIFSQEAFFKNAIPVVSFGKLRASYGTTGNDNVGNYLFTSNWSALSSGVLYNGGIGYIPGNLQNPDFSWSTTTKLESGIELGFLNDRIVLTTSWFRNRSSNQLIQYQLPSQTGFANVTENFQAVVQNTGWEFMLSGTVLKTNEFTWKTAFNITVPQNKLIDFPGLASSSYGQTLVIGEPVSIVRGYKYAGVNPTTGVYQFQTANGTITSNPSAANGDNKFIIGNTDPKLYGGLRNTFSYKGFQLDVFFEFRKQMGMNYLGAVTNAIGTQSNVPVDALDVWRNPGDQATYQRLTSQTSGTAAATAFGFYRQSDAVYSDASYIRLKTAGFSYNLKSTLVKKIGMNTCRIYVNGQNLLLITKYKGNDPETQNYYGIPPVRTIAAGLDFGL
ncbi:MAG: SusC/RagA family TonB-linked outer membrane protein [Bacteroidota bacterium]|nr:SusC/RagA family TonB-linked outer membrane protein [Bacteroidota bacterium]